MSCRVAFDWTAVIAWIWNSSEPLGRLPCHTVMNSNQTISFDLNPWSIPYGGISSHGSTDLRTLSGSADDRTHPVFRLVH